MFSVVVCRVFFFFHFSQYLAILSHDSNCVNNLMKCLMFFISMTAIIDFFTGTGKQCSLL